MKLTCGISTLNQKEKVHMCKKILDATAGGRMMWFDKNHPDALYVDRRTAPKGSHPVSPGWSVTPDVLADFTDMPFDDGSFHLVVFDPPHVSRKNPAMWKSNVGMMYGALPKPWQPSISDGFAECWRVLAANGTLIFKWAESEIPLKEVLELIPEKPLFGTRTGKRGSTVWLAFFKSE